MIDDGNGYRSIYAHFSKVRVKAGDVVKAGQLIGWEGDTGRASGCHLHYGLFSPYETKRFGLHPDTAKRMKLPRWEVARVNPLLVLPYRKGISPASMKPTDQHNGALGRASRVTRIGHKPRRTAGGCRLVAVRVDPIPARLFQDCRGETACRHLQPQRVRSCRR